MKEIEERQFQGTEWRDEIVNSSLMEIATGRSWYLQGV